MKSEKEYCIKSAQVTQKPKASYFIAPTLWLIRQDLFEFGITASASLKPKSEKLKVKSGKDRIKDKEENGLVSSLTMNGPEFQIFN